MRIQGLDLPTAVEVDFAVAGASESIARIGTTKDGVTDVVIPRLTNRTTGKNLVAYMISEIQHPATRSTRLTCSSPSGQSRKLTIGRKDKELFGQAIEAVNTAADRAEKARQTAQEAATKTDRDDKIRSRTE